MAFDIAKIKGIKAGPKKPIPPKPPIKMGDGKAATAKINPAKVKGLK